MQVVLNGERTEVEPGSTVADLVRSHGLEGRRVAIERNGSIVARTLWEATPVDANDAIEIVHFVGGG